MIIWIGSSHQTRKNVLVIRTNIHGTVLFDVKQEFYANKVSLYIIENSLIGYIDDIFRGIDILRRTGLWLFDDYVMYDGDICAFPAKFRHLEYENMLSMMRRLNAAEQLNEFDD